MMKRCSIPQLVLQPLHERRHLILQPRHPHPSHNLRVDDRRHPADRPLQLVIDDDVLIQINRLQLLKRGLQSPRQLRSRFCLTLTQPLQQCFGRRGKDEYRNRLREDPRELLRSLNVDVHHDMFSRRQYPLHLRPQRAIQVPMDVRRLSELARVPLALELGARQKIIILPVRFADPRYPRRTRNRVAEVRPLSEQLASDRRLSAARRRRKDDRKRVHSRFSTCSRIRSSSSLMPSTSWRITASFPLLPVVFASRNSSCNKNPNRFPTPSLEAFLSVSRNASRCDRNREISSLTSKRSARTAISCASRWSSIETPPANSCTA